MDFSKMVRSELEQACMRFHPFHTLHEAYAVILEEVDELWDHVRVSQNKRDRAAILKELVQIAAMAERAARDLRLDGNEKDGGVP